MIAELNGMTRPITRQRRGLLWCPWCDRSWQDSITDCAKGQGGCGACFGEPPALSPVRPAVEAPSPVAPAGAPPPEPPPVTVPVSRNVRGGRRSGRSKAQ